MAHRSGAGSDASREMLSTRHRDDISCQSSCHHSHVTTHQDEYISSVYFRNASMTLATTTMFCENILVRKQAPGPRIRSGSSILTEIYTTFRGPGGQKSLSRGDPRRSLIETCTRSSYRTVQEKAGELFVPFRP